MDLDWPHALGLPVDHIVRPYPFNGPMDKDPQGIWDSDPSLTWLTPTLAILLLSPLSTQPTPCLPQLGNMPQAPAQAHCLRLPIIQAAALPTGINVTCIPAHPYAHQLTFTLAIMKGLHSRKGRALASHRWVSIRDAIA